LCSVTLSAGKLKNKPKATKWEAIGSGDSAKDQAIRDVAMQILIDIDSETRKITVNWRSLSRLRQGIDLLQKSSAQNTQGQPLLTQARLCFQESVLEDPANWVARFNLGTVLRKLGFNSLAAEQFAELQRLSSLPPEFVQAARYNQGAALQGTDDDNLAKQAIAILNEVLGSSPLKPALKRLALSGRLAATADRLSRRDTRLHRIGGDPEQTALREEATGELAEGANVLETVEEAITKGDGRHGADDNVVLAVTLNAVGQLKGLLGHSMDARALYRRALTLLPSFIQPSLNLAALYLDKKSSLDVNWATRAERLLLDVQVIDVTNIRGMVLLGRLYSNPIFGRNNDAKVLLNKAMPDPEAGRRLAGILFEEGNPGDAIAPLLSSIDQDSLGSGHLLLARCTLELPATDRRKAQLLIRCQKALESIIKGTLPHSLVKEAVHLLPLVTAAAQERSEPKAPNAVHPEPNAPP
jgi:tetratricopeptide (TPR) repeat protein